MEVPLRHKSYRLLHLFVENAGRLLERDTIIQSVWPGMSVSDDSITQCVRGIRRAIGDVDQSTIKAIPRRGYIFTSEVTAERRAQRPPNYGILTDKPAIAVIPFVNFRGDQEPEYFSDGLSDDLINSLSRSRSLSVVTRSSSLSYKGRAVDVKQAASELGVRYVVEGSVRHIGRRLRINAQLTDAETGYHALAQRYDCTVDDVFAVQDELSDSLTIAITSAVAEAELRRALRQSHEHLGAWEAYQRGLWHLAKGSQADNGIAKKFFERAIAADASFAAAYSDLALAYKREGDTYAMVSLDEAEKRGDLWARRSVEIDSTDADALAVLAFSTPYANREEAYERIARALQANPHSSRAHGVKGSYLIFDGQPNEAREEVLRALRLNPCDPINATLRPFIAVSYYFEHEYARAVKAAKQAILQHPEYPLTYRWLAAALGQLGLRGEARDALQRAMDVSSNSLESSTRNQPPWMRSEDYAHMLEGLAKGGWQ